MEFRLTYAGKLMAANNGPSLIKHKHEIRTALHPQLKNLWKKIPHLAETLCPEPRLSSEEPKTIEILANKFKCGQYRFVPLVTSTGALTCSLQVLMLRPTPPGSLIQSGDLDNRLKVLFDALRVPQKQELTGCIPNPGEDPFFCLLEDDKLITKIALETDTLLEPISNAQIDDSDVRLVITVNIRGTAPTFVSLAFNP